MPVLSVVFRQDNLFLFRMRKSFIRQNKKLEKKIQNLYFYTEPIVPYLGRCFRE